MKYVLLVILSVMLIGSIIYGDKIIYGTKIFLQTNHVPLDLVYEPWVDQSKISGSEIINCIHGGACPNGVTYYDYVYNAPVTNTSPPPTVTQEPTLPVEPVVSQIKKSAYLASVVTFKTVYSDGSIIQNLLPSGYKYSVKLVEASLSTNSPSKTISYLVYEPSIDINNNPTLVITNAKVKYEIFVSNEKSSRIIDSKTVDGFHLESNKIKFSNVTIPYKTIAQYVKLLDGDQYKFNVIMGSVGLSRDE